MIYASRQAVGANKVYARWVVCDQLELNFRSSNANAFARGKRHNLNTSKRKKKYGRHGDTSINKHFEWMVLMTKMNNKKIIKSINSSCIPRVTPDSRYRHIKEFYSFQITLAITILLHDTKKVIKFYDPPAQLVLRSSTPADLAANRKILLIKKPKYWKCSNTKRLTRF